MVDLQPHSVPFAAVVQLVLHCLEQVGRLLLVDVKLAVARHPERPIAQQLCAREQIGQVMHHGHVLVRLTVPSHLQPHDEVQRLVEQLRKRMRRVDRQRRQHRVDLRAVIIFHPDQVRLLQLLQLQQADAVGRQGRRQFVPPAGILLLHHPPHPLDDGAEGFGTGQTVHRALHRLALDLLLQAGDADLEELIQVRADDAKELHPLQQRVFRVECLLEHPMIEFQPAQFPIDEMSRAESQCFCFGFHNRQQGNRLPQVWKVTKHLTIAPRFRGWRRRADQPKVPPQ